MVELRLSEGVDYAGFISSLGTAGVDTKRVVDAFIEDHRAKKIEFAQTSAIPLSRVGDEWGDHAVVFFPARYDLQAARFEATRIMIDALRAVRNPIADEPGIEASVRRELSNAKTG